MSGTTFATAFSGIGAPEVAWSGLGWTPLWVAEIEPFPSAVLAARVGVPNLGDARGIPAKLRAGEVGAPDIFCGGSPCQAFSVAGLRQSLADDRGNLTLAFVEIADAIDDARRVEGRDPSIIVWENVPGVLNVKDNAFGCFLGALVGEDEPLVPDGGKWSDAGLVVGPTRRAAWRVIDAQGFVPQRRRRVFVVASALDGFDPSQVLHEEEADFEFGVADGWSGWALLPQFARMRRDPAASGEAREGTAPTLAARTRGGGGLGTDAELDGALIAYGGNNTSGPIDVATARSAHGGPHGRLDFETETFIASVAGTLNSNGKAAGNATQQDAETGMLVACVTGDITHTLKADGFDASEDGTGRGQPIVPAWPQTVADPITANEQRTYTHEGTTFRVRNVVPGEPLPFDTTQLTHPANRSSPKPGDPCHPLASGAHPPAIAFTAKDHGMDAGPIAPTLRRGHSNGGTAPAIAFTAKDYGGDAGPISPTLRAMQETGGNANGGGQVAVAFQSSQSGVRVADTHATLDANNGSRRHNGIANASAVRRLTPTECARLQGFPDDWCDILFRGKPAADGPKYKAFGNAMCVDVVRWIGERIAAEMGRING